MPAHRLLPWHATCKGRSADGARRSGGSPQIVTMRRIIILASSGLAAVAAVVAVVALVTQSRAVAPPMQRAAERIARFAAQEDLARRLGALVDEPAASPRDLTSLAVAREAVALVHAVGASADLDTTGVGDTAGRVLDGLAAWQTALGDASALAGDIVRASDLAADASARIGATLHARSADALQAQQAENSREGRGYAARAAVSDCVVTLMVAGDRLQRLEHARLVAMTTGDAAALVAVPAETAYLRDLLGPTPPGLASDLAQLADALATLHRDLVRAAPLAAAIAHARASVRVAAGDLTRACAHDAAAQVAAAQIAGRTGRRAIALALALALAGAIGLVNWLDQRVAMPAERAHADREAGDARSQTHLAELATARHEMATIARADTLGWQRVATLLEELSTADGTVAGIAHDATHALTQGSGVARALPDAADALRHAVAGVRSAAARQSDLMAEIRALAARTNVLGLNAAIEAARFDTDGEGMTVVASELRQAGRQANAAFAGYSAALEAAQASAAAAGTAGDRVASLAADLERQLNAAATGLPALHRAAATVADTADALRDTARERRAVARTGATAGLITGQAAPELADRAKVGMAG